MRTGQPYQEINVLFRKQKNIYLSNCEVSVSNYTVINFSSYNHICYLAASQKCWMISAEKYAFKGRTVYYLAAKFLGNLVFRNKSYVPINIFVQFKVFGTLCGAAQWEFGVFIIQEIYDIKIDLPSAISSLMSTLVPWYMCTHTKAQRHSHPHPHPVEFI